MLSKEASAHIERYYQSLAPMKGWMWSVFRLMLHEKRLAPGELLLAEGQVCDFVAFIHAGLVATVHIPESGTERIFTFAAEGEYISGYPSFITGEPVAYAIRAIEPTTVVLLYRRDMDRLYRLSPPANLWGRLVEEQAFVGILRRLLSLHVHAPEMLYQQLADSRPDLLQRVPQYMIAAYIGVTPEALSRIRRRMMAGS
jgi:CRP-like cAMP-binding protein